MSPRDLSPSARRRLLAFAQVCDRGVKGLSRPDVLPPFLIRGSAQR